MRKLLLLFLLLVIPHAHAGTVKVAVAANFTAPMRELAKSFERATGHRALVSYGSTGKLYAQIIHGAPFEVFLAADRERPALLHEAGLGEAGFTYAIGRLALWSPDPGLIDDARALLQQAGFSRLAIANPKTAPYGVGALQVLEALGALQSVQAKLVRGDNIAQTYQFVMTGNVPLAFVAISQVTDQNEGSLWVPPQSMYEPLRQNAILLERGREAPAAQAFIDYLQSPAARSLIARYGYATE